MLSAFKRLSAAAIAGMLAVAAPLGAQGHGGGGWHGGGGGWRGGGWHGGGWHGWDGGWHRGWGGGWWGGWGAVVGIPFAYPYVYAYPVYPAYPAYPYYQPYGYYAPPLPASGTVQPGFTCDAGRYVCPLKVVHPINGVCHCPTGNDHWIQGTVR